MRLHESFFTALYGRAHAAETEDADVDETTPRRREKETRRSRKRDITVLGVEYTCEASLPRQTAPLRAEAPKPLRVLEKKWRRGWDLNPRSALRRTTP